MTHLFKFCLTSADMFIRDITYDHIDYEIRDKVTGNLQEPRKNSKFDIKGGQVLFDGRFITVPALALVEECLYGTSKMRELNYATSSHRPTTPP